MAAACTRRFTMSPGTASAQMTAHSFDFFFFFTLVDFSCLLIIFHKCEGGEQHETNEHLHRRWRINETSLPRPRPGRSWARRPGAIVTMPVPGQETAAGCEAFFRHCPSDVW